MSALFQRAQGTIHEFLTIERTLELRKIPHLFEPRYPGSPHMGDISHWTILGNLYANLSTNWMYSATIQLALNSSEPNWSQNGWSFVPLDLSQISAPPNIQRADKLETLLTINITVTTPAIRGRIECSPYNELSNLSSWLTIWNLSDTLVWNASSNPMGWTSGYELGIQENPDQIIERHSDGQYFLDTSFLAAPFMLACCANDTHDITNGSAIGYWSPKTPLYMPYSGRYPINFTTKWIHGYVAAGLRQNNDSSGRLLFRDIPGIQALHCRPVIEKADSSVTVSYPEAKVQSFKILDNPLVAEEAWKEVYVDHVPSPDSENSPANNIINTTVR